MSRAPVPLASAALSAGLLAASLSGCALLDRRVWTESVPRAQIWNRSYRSEPLRPSLDACVAAHDPARLSALRGGGDYRGSEASEDADAIRAVKRCMASKGWVSIPAIDLGF